LHLPLRGENHGALPAYLVKASSTLFGTTALAYRAIHVLIGMLTIVMIYILTNQLYGPLAARWAASLIAFNEYFLSFSARATANTPYLFFVTLAVFAFSRFLAAERARYLYAAAVATGLAFYCKEHAVLLLPVFLAMLLGATYRRWLRSPHLYLAVVVFALVIGPDLAWNLRTGCLRRRLRSRAHPGRAATLPRREGAPRAASSRADPRRSCVGGRHQGSPPRPRGVDRGGAGR
jgi:dolichol-phosphate mannosyltransferase